MNKTSALPKTQAKALEILGTIEMSETDYRFAGGNLAAIYALAKKGIVTRENRLTVDSRVLNGQQFTETYYRAV